MKKPFTVSRFETVILVRFGLGLLLAASAFDGFGVGFRLPNQNPEAIARGNAFVATADNPSAIYYNPAGITQLEGQQINVGLYVITTSTDYESPTGVTAETKSKFQPVPQLHYVLTPKDSQFSFGLGVYVPYGLSMEWEEPTPFRTLAERGSLLYTTINPVVAWKVHPTLSLAIGPTINYSKGKFYQGVGFLPYDQFGFEGSGWAYGFNAGLLWQPHRQWSFGVNYRYSTEVEYDGTSEAFPYTSPTDTTGHLRFPQFVAAGVSYRPTENWNLEVNIDWTDWDYVNELRFDGTASGTMALPLNYKSSLMYEFGVTRKLPDGYFASVGYIFSENSIPDRSFNPIVPDADLHLGSIGFGHHGKRWDWAIAYHFAFNGGREVSGSQSTSLIGESADGTYETFNQAVTISTTFRF